MLQRVIGFILILLGVFIFISAPRFTGLAVLDDPYAKFGFQLIGLVFLIGGILLLTAGKKDLESQVEVYDDGRGKNLPNREQQHYFMNDSERAISNSGRVSLEDFEKQIDHYHKEEQGEELIEIIRDAYSPGLHNIVEQGGEKAKIARAFLDVLEEREEQDEDGTSISYAEKRKIKSAFRGWDGNPTREQLEVCGKYGITYAHGSKSGKFMLGPYSVTVSLTPSHEASSGITRDISNMIRKSREDSNKRKAS